MMDVFTEFLRFLDETMSGNVLLAIVALWGTFGVMGHYVLISRRLRIEERKSHLELDVLRAKLEASVYIKNKSLTRDPKNFNDVNHLIVESVGTGILDGSFDSIDAVESAFIRSLGVDTGRTKVKKGEVFVLTPHHSRFEKSYRIIKNVCSSLGLKATRGDESFTQSSILKHVVQKIVEAEVVFANIDGRNPNVFYELGIILTSEINEVPFDVANQRMIVWSNESELEHKITKAMAVYSLGLDANLD